MRQTCITKTPKTPGTGLLFLILLLLSSGLGSFAWGANAQKLFEQGLLKESGERDPENALDFFRQAAQEAGPRDPGLAADARLHMGQCLEKLGKMDEALGIFLVITQNPEGVSAETLQAAQANGVRIQADMKRAADQAALEAAARRSASMIMVPEFRGNGLSLLVGPAIVRGSGIFELRGDVDLRLRIFGDRPRPLYLEVGALTPGADQAMATSNFDTTDTYSGQPRSDQAKLHLGYQIHAAVVRDLPHGTQEAVVPEIGVGAAYTASRIDVTTYAKDNFTGLPTVSSQEVQFRIWSPFLRAGVRLFANHPVSLLLGVSYTAVPYKETVVTGAPAHTASFDFPGKVWTAGAQLQVRFGRTEYVARPKP
jgi:hypothetical protein